MADKRIYAETPYAETDALLAALTWDLTAAREILAGTTAAELAELATAAGRLAELAETMAEEKRHAR